MNNSVKYCNVMKSLIYNTRNNSLPLIEEGSLPVWKTSEVIINLERKILSRLDDLNKHILNLNAMKMKHIQIKINDYWERSMNFRIYLYAFFFLTNQVANGQTLKMV